MPAVTSLHHTHRFSLLSRSLEQCELALGATNFAQLPGQEVFQVLLSFECRPMIPGPPSSWTAQLGRWCVGHRTPKSRSKLPPEPTAHNLRTHPVPEESNQMLQPFIFAKHNSRFACGITKQINSNNNSAR